MSAASALFDFRHRLDGPGEPLERLTATLREAKAAFAEVGLPAILDDLLRDWPGCRDVLASGARLDHFGLVLPTWTKPIISTAATAAGFPLAHGAFPSALFTRELGRLLGARRVPTSIFKAHGRTEGEGTLAFEAFIPDTEPARVEAWVRAGVGRHVAVELAEATLLGPLRARFLAEGVELSAFMYGRPAHLPGENATIMYFDVDRSEYPVRLEIRVAGDHAGDGDA